MKQNILRSMAILTLIAVIITSVITIFVVYRINQDYIETDLEENANFILALLDESYTLDQFISSNSIANNSTRITIVAASGEVLYDNRVNAEEMENHGDRKEIQTAFETGEAKSRRLSSTLGISTSYYAVLLNDGHVIRFAREIDSFIYTLYRMLTLIVLIIVGVIIIALGIGDKMADSIITPINNIDLDKPLSNDVYDELSPLLTRIFRQNQDIKRQVRAYENQQEQFSTITTNMAEGLILLDHRARIVYINKSAFNILGDTGDEIDKFINENLLVLNRDLELRKTVQKALKGEHAETVLAIEGKSYQLLVSPIADEANAYGVIILLLDITQRYEIEKMRKEFSGNVSHELRTPLTAISSYAELLSSDMVKPEDVQGFARRIQDETTRMIALVDDILKLSRLDERVEIEPKEEVDLYDLALKVVDRLKPLSDAQKVELVVTGEPVAITGDAAILFEIIYNLCENGIKYNREQGGRVVVNCTQDKNNVVLEVTDNGIGIPAKYQPRIFERFYRVDQSHSRKTGGTGLGLAIVKHAAAYHDATVNLESKEKVGTKITIKFP